MTFFEEFEPATQWQIRQAMLRGAEHAPSLAPTIGAAFDPESSRITSEEAPVDVALNVSQPAVSLEEHFESQRSRERPNL